MAEASAASLPDIGEAEEHPAPLAEARDEPSLGHQLQVTADARLALSKDLGQVLDVQLAAGEQRQDAQPRGLARGAKAAQGLGAGQISGMGLGLVDT